MKKYLLRIRIDLFEQVKLLSRKYNISINKMFIKLIEIGYLTFIGGEINEEKNLYKRRD